MVKSDHVVPCKYASASPPAQNFVRKVIFFLLMGLGRDQTCQITLAEIK